MVIVTFYHIVVGVAISDGVGACISPGHRQGCSLQSNVDGPCFNPKATCTEDKGVCKLKDGEKCNKDTYTLCLDGAKCALTNQGSCCCVRGASNHSYTCTESPECIPTGCTCQNYAGVLVSDMFVGEHCHGDSTTKICRGLVPVNANITVVESSSTPGFNDTSPDIVDMYDNRGGARFSAPWFNVACAAFGVLVTL
ncbi:uncharacterized protein [Littorina saxatilis]|uniref:Uncharacterized protein n=1 Tax=Littorina saxatilis TaxID=31220 RepID=A0AAN9B2M1_9CAEN